MLDRIGARLGLQPNVGHPHPAAALPPFADAPAEGATMPRKPTGRDRGRPKGTLLYPIQDRILLEVAKLSGGDPSKEPSAARAVAKFVGGPVVDDESKVRRILRQYRPRRDWFLMRAKAPSTERSRPRQNGPLFMTAYGEAERIVQRMAERQQQFERMVTESPLAQETRRLEETQRMFDSMLKEPFV